MKLVKLSIFNRLSFRIFDITRAIFGERAMVETYLYPKQISDYLKDDFFMTGINHNIMLKSSHDRNWYTNDPESKFGLLIADEELADKLNIIDCYYRELCKQCEVDIK